MKTALVAIAEVASALRSGIPAKRTQHSLSDRERRGGQLAALALTASPFVYRAVQNWLTLGA